jgi:hypothetical protein
VPFILSISKPSEQVPFVYNIDHPVGLHCPNNRLDVMLVQVLLFANQRGIEGGCGSLDDKQTQALGPLEPNGKFDNRSLAWIFHYQLASYGRNAAMITGRVEPLAQLGSTPTGNTMLADVNVNVLQIWPAFRDVTKAPLPGELAAALRARK